MSDFSCANNWLTKRAFFGKRESSSFENTLTKLWRNFVFNPEITDNLKKLMSTGWIDDQWLKSYLKKVKRLFGNKKFYKWSKFSNRFSTRNRKFIKKNLKGIFFNYVTKINTFGSSQEQLSLSKRQLHGITDPICNRLRKKGFDWIESLAVASSLHVYFDSAPLKWGV